MPVSRRSIAFLAALALALPLAALAATPITGVVTNKTTGKPSAGDDVTLIRLAQGMQDSTHTKTDSRGRYTLEVPEDGLHLVRVTHDKATYFRPAPPGTQSVDIDVYNAAEQIDGVSTGVQELHIEATATELHVVEILQVVNKSAPARTQFGPAGYDFYLPTGAVIQRTAAVTDGGMPVQAAAVPMGDPDHYKILFPIRPGETQFGIFYNLPYKGSYDFKPKLATTVATFAVLVPKSIKVKAAASTPLTLGAANSPSSDTYTIQNVSPSQPLEFTISGQGELPRDADKAQPANDGAPVAATDNKMPGKGLDNPLDPDGDRDPWAKYKWWMLIGLVVLLAIAAGFLLKKPTEAVVSPERLEPAHIPAATPAARNAHLLTALKEEMFALETDRLQNRISDSEYAEQKAAIELILRRALGRSGQ